VQEASFRRKDEPEVVAEDPETDLPDFVVFVSAGKKSNDLVKICFVHCSSFEKLAKPQAKVAVLSLNPSA
jgi:hypothetical protein